MTLRREPAWGDVAAAVSGPDLDRATMTGGGPSRVDREPDAGRSSSIEDLERDVYTERNLQGDDRDEARRLLDQARSQLSDATYRRALELARDSALLSVEECISGALAMEWNPMPRPEFSLATIEAAVAEQDRRQQR